MRSEPEREFSLPVAAAAPLALLSARTFRVSFRLPSPLLRALGSGEAPQQGMWSDWLAEWGWTWAVGPDTCAPRQELIGVWLDRGRWPPGFDARVLSLAAALRLRVDGEPLPGEGVGTTDLARVWNALCRVSRENLAEGLALALLRADGDVFDFRSAAPAWPADVGRVIAERRQLVDEREPSPVWLREGYRLLGDDGFGMLRANGASLADCDAVWESFADRRELPAAFALCFWWEATYCLTERHAYADAEKAQVRLEQLVASIESLTGLIDPMWHHQQGRLHYYAGNHESALAEYLREYQLHGDDLRVAAMLLREIANVLSDIGCLDAAQAFASRSVDAARKQGQRAELYKSLGRLAELALKRGEAAEAVTIYEESLQVQRKSGTDNRAPAQTLTYLGHASLLAGNIAEADRWYVEAEAADGDGTSAPYLAMGRLAWALAGGDAVGVTQRWSACAERISVWKAHQTHVLPATVCVLAAARHVPAARALLPGLARALVDNRYAIEAACLLPEIPDDQRGGLEHDIEQILKRWQRALDSMPEAIKKDVGPLDGPRKLLDTLRRRKLSDEPAQAWAGYPLTLAACKP